MDDLIAMLETCQLQFLSYADQHEAKTRLPAAPLTPEQRASTLDKARVNRDLAARIAEVLARHNGSRDLASVTHVPDYRFATMHKGEHYAFARGLTINPSHLPGALDAMERDGWTLLAIFGETDAQNIGFIFQKKGATHIEVDLRARVNELLKSNTDLLLKNRELSGKLA